MHFICYPVGCHAWSELLGYVCKQILCFTDTSYGSTSVRSCSAAWTSQPSKRSRLVMARNTLLRSVNHRNYITTKILQVHKCGNKIWKVSVDMQCVVKRSIMYVFWFLIFVFYRRFVSLLAKSTWYNTKRQNEGFSNGRLGVGSADRCCSVHYPKSRLGHYPIKFSKFKVRICAFYCTLGQLKTTLSVFVIASSTVAFGPRSFAPNVPKLWSSLPPPLRNSLTLTLKLKLYLC